MTGLRWCCDSSRNGESPVVTWIDRECTGLSDWNAKLERANGEIAELHVRISFQGEIIGVRSKL